MATERLIIAINQTLQKMNQTQYVNCTNKKLNQFVFSCPILMLIEYEEKHDKIRHHICWKICKYYEILESKKWHKHQPWPIPKAKGATILWDLVIQTDKEIKRNRPAIVVKDYKRKHAF